MTVKFDPAHTGSSGVLSGSNLIFTPTNGQMASRADTGWTIAHTSKVQWEFKYTAVDPITVPSIGIAVDGETFNGSGLVGYSTNSSQGGWSFADNDVSAAWYHSGAANSVTVAVHIGGGKIINDVIAVVLDPVGLTLKFYLVSWNGSGYNAPQLAYTITGITSAIKIYPTCGSGNGGALNQAFQANFGATTFAAPGLGDISYETAQLSAPVASFTLDAKFGIAPLAVQFSDTSTNSPTSWLWDFGDGTTSTEQNPSHSYTLAGYYTVALTATNVAGSDTHTSTYAVIVRPLPTPFPRIAWDNALASDDCTLSASSQASGYEKENAVDWRPYTWWKPTASGVSWLNGHFGSAVAANCIAIYAHTLGAAGATVKAQFSVDGGSTYYDATPSVAPADTETIYLVFPYCERADWRLYIDASIAAPVVGCVFIGVDMTLERGSRPSSPAMFNRDNVITNTVSQNGIWLGRSLINRGWMVNIALDFLTESFVRDSWLPFVEHAELKPWFLLWDELTRYTEAAWCFADGGIPGSQYTSATLMNAAVKAKAYIE